MASQTVSTCNHYAARCTKTSTKILHQKNSKKEENAPDSARKRRNRVRFGCWGGVQPVRTGGETRNPNQNAPDSNATHEKRKPAKTQCFRRFFGRGRRTCLACRLGRFAAERHWRSLAPRHAVLEWMWESAPGSGKRPMSSGSLRKSQRGRCWFGAVSSFWRRIVYRLPLLPAKEKHLRQEDGQADQDHGRVGPGSVQLRHRVEIHAVPPGDEGEGHKNSGYHG